MTKERVRRIAKMAAIGIVAMGIFGFVVMNLWNWLAPAVFGARTVTFWQGLGLLVLARILVGGFGGGQGRQRHWRRRTEDRWEQLTPEERERFRQRLAEHRGGRPDGMEPGAAQ